MLPTVSRRTLRVLPSVFRAHYASTASTEGIKISATDSGIKVATLDETSPAAALAVVVNTGTRAETPETEGTAHFLKNWGFQNNESRTAFRITREAEILGGVLSSSLGRESLVYSAEFLSDDAEYFSEILCDVISQTKFQEHEFDAIAERVHTESAYASQDPSIVALDTAHGVAFRAGLGNSLFAGPTSKAKASTVKSFAHQNFRTGNIALVGSGIQHERLLDYARRFITVHSGKSNTADSKYYGGEQRIPLDSDESAFLLAYSAPALSSPEYAAAQVLKYALGGDSYLKWSFGISPLSQVAAKFNGLVQVSSFHQAYSDAGLFGVLVLAESAHVSQAASAAVEQLKGVGKNIKPDDLKRAVAQAKFASASANDTRISRVQNVGFGALTGNYINLGNLSGQFNAVKASDVANVAQKIFSSKPTTVAVGEIRALPYIDSFSL